MTTPRYDLFEHEGRVYECGPAYPNHTAEDERPLTAYPVEVMLDCRDVGDGEGWGRSRVAQHAEVLDSYLYDVGSEEEYYAVTVRVASEQDLLALLRYHDLLGSKPKPL